MRTLLFGFIFMSTSISSYAINIDSVLNNYKLESDVVELETSYSLLKEIRVVYGQSSDTESGTRFKRDLDDRDLISSDDRSGDEFGRDFSIRFSLNSFANYKNKEELAKVQYERLQKVQSEQQNQELSMIYKLYIKFHFGIQERDRLKKLLETNEDSARVSKVLLKKGKVFITDVIHAEKKISDTHSLLRVKEEEVRNTKVLLEKLTGVSIKESSISKQNNFVNVNKIVSMVKKAPKLSFSNLEVKKAQLEYEIEKEESNQFLDFIELETSNSSSNSIGRNALENEFTDSDSRQQNYGIKIGFTIPFFIDKSDMHEKKITKVRKEHEAKMENRASLEELDEIKAELIGLVESLKSLLGSSYLKRTKRYLSVYKNSKGVSPFRLLQLKSILTETEIKQAQIESSIYEKYISFLETRGSLAKYKRENVLSPKFRGEV